MLLRVPRKGVDVHADLAGRDLQRDPSLSRCLHDVGIAGGQQLGKVVDCGAHFGQGGEHVGARAGGHCRTTPNIGTPALANASCTSLIERQST